MDNNEIASEASTLLLVFVHGGLTTATRDIARQLDVAMDESDFEAMKVALDLFAALPPSERSKALDNFDMNAAGNSLDGADADLMTEFRAKLN